MTALVEEPTVEQDVEQRDYMVLRQVFLDEKDQLILLAIWNAYREHGGCTWRYLVRVTGISMGDLRFRIFGFVWVGARRQYVRRTEPGLMDRGLVDLAPALRAAGIRPGPRLAMMNKGIPYQLVRVDL